ncbi:MAG: ATP-binding protein, partial [Chloroflexota bacterium]
ITQIEPLPLLEEITERARLLATGQHIRMEWPETDPGSLLADASAVRRALNNLVENALHHTLAGKSIVLSLKPGADGCWFLVSDEGCGIAPEHIPHLCDRFYRVDSARTRKNGGSGLGLAIVHAIVTAHNGRIAMKSAPGDGTIVRVWLPHNGPQKAPQYTTAVLLPKMYETLELPETQDTVVTNRSGGWIHNLLPFMVGALFVMALFGGTLLFTHYIGPRLLASGGDQPYTPNESEGIVMNATQNLVADNDAVSSVARFDEAVQFASEQVDQTNPVEVWHESGTNLYEVTFSDRTDVYVDIEQRQVIEIDVPDLTGPGVGVERQQTERARVVAAIVQGLIEISFDEAAMLAAQNQEGSFVPEEIELRWQYEQARVMYVVESIDDQEVVVDPQTGEVFEMTDEDSDDDDN